MMIVDKLATPKSAKETIHRDAHLALSNHPKRCGIFGGTFDPIHLGHITTVKQVLRWLRLDQVRYIPAAVPPHREQPGSSAEQRLDMTQIATAAEPLLVVDDIELRRDGPSYSIDTIEALQRQYNDTAFVLILGLDALLSLNQWHRWQQILHKAEIVAMLRPGWSLPTTLPAWLLKAGFEVIDSADAAQNSSHPARILVLPVEPTTVSASAIRAGIQQREDVSAMLHPGVWQYIKSNQLYA